jgi:alpha-N-arabinofuranosidase
MAETSATITINTEDVISEIPRTIFGGFVEHLGRCVYEGIYDPKSKHADERGLRKDVLAALREMDMSVIRYPGGNFVSGYRWMDGVGPKDKRPTRHELAWNSIEPNQFGTNEFVDFCRELKVEPMLGCNFGTGTIEEVGNYVEYCNGPVGTQYADLRKSHGYEKPHGVKYWCLGNEMDGPWQIGHMSAEDYAKKAREAARIMLMEDRSIKTIICGSSGPFMKTFPAWDRTALEMCWPHAHYLSLHNYATNWENDTASFLAYSAEFEKHIDRLATVLRETKQKVGGKHDIYLSQDEWNVWYKDRNGDGKRTFAPHLCEEPYDLQDVLVVAQWMNVFLRKCDVLKMACLAQVVNVIAPLKTRGDELLKESIFYPFVMYSANARGAAVRAKVESPRYTCKRFGEVPVIDVAATVDEANRKAAVFIVHRATSETLMTRVSFEGKNPPVKVVGAKQIWGLDPKAGNTFDRPDVVLPREVGAMPFKEGAFPIKLPPLSVTMVLLDLA